MAKNVRKHTEKMAAVCPHCGFTQEESVAAKSTFCRKCQQHYNLERMLAGEKSIVKEPGLFSKLARLVLGDREREVTCFTCGHKQKLSKEAQSTMCPECGAYMDLRDFKISGAFGRSVQTAGDVYVTSRGDVTSTRLLCGALYLEGSLRGCVKCTGTATLHFKGRLGGVLDAAHVLVDKRSEVEFAKPIQTKLFEVNGKARGDVIADKVVINKGGSLEGSVHARAITVDKGGVFTGDLTIGQDSVPAAEPAPAPAEDQAPAEPVAQPPQAPPVAAPETSAAPGIQQKPKDPAVAPKSDTPPAKQPGKTPKIQTPFKMPPQKKRGKDAELPFGPDA